MFRSFLYGEDLVSDLPIRATGSMPYSSYMCMGSALDVMDYGLAEAMGVGSELTAETLLILRINTLWS